MSRDQRSFANYIGDIVQAGQDIQDRLESAHDLKENTPNSNERER
jgi:hypothetical protein